MKKIIVLIVILLSVVSCENVIGESFYSIAVKNKSSSEIRVYIADNALHHYPDTLLPILKPSLQKAAVNRSVYFTSQISWEDILKKIPSNILSVYIIDNEVYENESWDSIRIHYKVLNRLDLSIEELKDLDWKITYEE